MNDLRSNKSKIKLFYHLLNNGLLKVVSCKGGDDYSITEYSTHSSQIILRKFGKEIFIEIVGEITRD